jgi:predicted MFS family arabinose efflux permease
MMVGCVFLGLFLLIEARIQSPMVPLALFKSFSFSGANLLTLFLYGATGIFFFLFPLNLIQVQKYSATATGAAMLPMILLIFLLSRWSGGLVARYGSRLPLIIGPLVAASGFILFALPSIGRVYWRSFFPGVAVLGFGMAITVAPLTTVVMNSVGEDRVGAASGINNAVARIAGVLAIAILGIVMVRAFSLYLDRSLAHLSLSTQILGEIQSNETSLAAMQPPDGLGSKIRINVSQSIEEAFVFGFRIVMGLCAALALASSLIAWLMIPDRSESPS